MLQARVGFCRKTARQLLRDQGVGKPETPLEMLVEACGYRVMERDWPMRTSGILLREHKVIGVNRNHPWVRRRFTVAHELGHHCLNHYLWFESNHAVTIDN